MAKDSATGFSFAEEFQSFTKRCMRFLMHLPDLYQKPGDDGVRELVGVVGSVIVLVVLGVLAWKSYRRDEKMKNVPPGSFGFPFLGETLSFMAALRANKPEIFYLARAQKYGKVFKSSLMGFPVVSVDAPAGNKFIFANDGKLVDNFYSKSTHDILGKESFSLRPYDEHRRLRRIIMTCLTGEVLQSFAPRMEACVLSHLAEYWEGKEKVVAASSIKQFAFVLSCDLFLGLQDGPELAQLEKDYNVMLDGLLCFPINLPGFRYYRALQARAIVLLFLDSCISRRRKELQEGTATPVQDLLSIFLTTPDENGKFLTDAVIKDNLLFVVSGGFETSSNTMTLALKHLAENPSHLAEVLKEQLEVAKQKEGEGLTLRDTKAMKYTWRVLQETVRLHPIVLAGFREVITTFDYQGYTIPKGWKMIWTPSRSHMDPEIFPDPEKFDPSRYEGSGPDPYAYLPFGGGPHTCPGIEYAKLEMLLYFHYVVTRFQWSLVDPKEKITVDPLPHPVHGLCLNISPRRVAN